jgi:uncharacterized protein
MNPRGVILIAHGFKGYKEYGMFPRLAAEFAAAGFMAHRFNFSHSGMTNQVETFERPDLFERDTLNKQVFDLRRVIRAMRRGDIQGASLPYVIFGHSRGGLTALLTSGRFADDPAVPSPVGVITAAAPSSCNSLTQEEQRQILHDGFLVSPSSRTGQDLRIGRAFLQEQLDDPAGHDLLAMVARIRCPLLVIHGKDDPTVPADCARAIADAATAPVDVELIPHANHVFNTPNPMPIDADPSPQLRRLMDASIAFARRTRSASYEPRS